MKKNKVALGTVQFGLPYGISNQTGQVSSSEVGKILNLASLNDIHTLDTAIAYGNSENVLGLYDLDGFDIVTKLPPVPEDIKDIAGWVEQQVTGSFDRLKISKVHAVLLHRPEQLHSEFGTKLYDALSLLKTRGLAERIGISIYSPDELLNLYKSYHFDLIQAPFNVLDARLQESGALDILEKQGTGLHVRSIFLQGLLLMNTRPNKFHPWLKLWQTWDQWLIENQLTPLEACIQHALSVPQIEKVVIGVDSESQLQEIVNATKGEASKLPENLSCNDERLLSPHLWSQL